mmetsp:Transcript_88087/g.247658  ORF Transcript_88087/g.247658 Transcript_88087/m.247658 type:complete len:338 (+) Transcript_88087:95-1108(+)
MKPLSLLRTTPEGHISLVPDEPAAKVTRPLKLTNTSDGSVAWKVRTNAPEGFLVRPRSGVLNPGESVEAEITRLPGAIAEGIFALIPRFEVRAACLDKDQHHVERGDWISKWRACDQEAGYVTAILRNAVVSRDENAGKGTAVRQGRQERPLEPSLNGFDSPDPLAVGDDEWTPARRRGPAACEQRSGMAGPRARGVRADLHPSYCERGGLEDPSRPIKNNRAWSGGYDPDCDSTLAPAAAPYDRRSGGEASTRRRPPVEPDMECDREHVGRSAKRPVGASAEKLASQCSSTTGETQQTQMRPATKAILGLLISVLFFNLYLKPLLHTVTNGHGAEA